MSHQGNTQFSVVHYISDTYVLHRAGLFYGIVTAMCWCVPLRMYCSFCSKLILSKGEPGKRHCLPNATIMIHRMIFSSLN
jgi:hypothetical protein